MFVFSTTYCDIIPDNSHYVSKCVKITNLEDYPHVSLIGSVETMSGDKYTYQISSTDCLYIGYKMEVLTLFAVSNTYIGGKNVEKLNLPGNKNALISNVAIVPVGYYAANSNSISSTQQFYKILGFTDSTVVLFKWKEISGYNDGTPEKTEFFDYTGNLSALTQEFPITQIYDDPADINYPKILKTELFPNPAKDYLALKTEGSYPGELNVKIYTMDGRLVKSNLFSKTSPVSYFSIPTNDIPKGSYVVRIEYGEIVESAKLLIN